jgi:hypothetical protein
MRQKQKGNQTMKMMKKDDHHPAAARLIIISHNHHNTHMVASELGQYHHHRLLQQSHPAGERERERERAEFILGHHLFAAVQSIKCSRISCHLEFQSSSLPIIHAINRES